MEVVYEVNETMDNIIPWPDNEFMGASIVDEHCQWVMFNVTLDF